MGSVVQCEYRRTAYAAQIDFALMENAVTAGVRSRLGSTLVRAELYNVQFPARVTYLRVAVATEVELNEVKRGEIAATINAAANSAGQGVYVMSSVVAPIQALRSNLPAATATRARPVPAAQVPPLRRVRSLATQAVVRSPVSTRDGVSPTQADTNVPPTTEPSALEPANVIPVLAVIAVASVVVVGGVFLWRAYA